MSVHCIMYEGAVHLFTNTHAEDDRMFFDRCMFKVKNKVVYNDPDELEAMSHLWIHKKYMQVGYDDQVENTLLKANSIYAKI